MLICGSVVQVLEVLAVAVSEFPALAYYALSLTCTHAGSGTCLSPTS